MSSTLSTSEVKSVKPVEQTSSETTNQTDSMSTDTNSTAQHEISPQKRGHSEITGTSEDQTPAKSTTKKSRIERFKEESEALLKTYGLNEGTDSEKRLTRSRTRGTPVTTPVTKPEPKKTATKRGRKSVSEKEESPVVKITPQFQKKINRGGRKGPIQDEADEEQSAAAVENSENTEVIAEPELKSALLEDQVESVTDGDKKETTEKCEVAESTNDVKEEVKSPSLPKVVVTKETKEPVKTEVKSASLSEEPATPAKTTTLIKVIEGNKSAIVEPVTKNSNSDSKPVNETNSVTNDTKVENNVTNNQTNEHANKVAPVVEVPTVEEKVVSKDTKSAEPVVVEKQEVQSA